MAKQVIDEFALMNKKVQQRIHYFALETTEQILQNMQDLEISPYGKKFSGDLERSIHADIHNNANGDEALIQFYYMNYAQYVEMAVGKGMKYMTIPQLTTGKPLRPIPRPDGKPRMAKPFMMSEIRLHARMLMDRLARQYAYTGSVVIMQSVANATTQGQVLRSNGYKRQTTKDWT